MSFVVLRGVESGFKETVWLNSSALASLRSPRSSGRVARAYHQLQKQPTVILKHAFLASRRDQNQVLFYRLMQDHLKELLGILYTPGAAEAVMGYSYLFRRPLGCFIVSKAGVLGVRL